MGNPALCWPGDSLMDGINELDGALQGLLTQIGPQGRRALAREIATRIRQRNQQRVADQVAPDGTPFTPRLRAKRGSIKRRMFVRLRTARWLKARSSADEAVVEFVGAAARIARVHHGGLRDRVRPGGPEHQYAARPLLGINGDDIGLLESLVVDHIAR